MTNRIKKTFKGSLEVPGDKSITHRAVMIGSLSKGTTTIYKPLISDDILRTIQCMKELGAYIHIEDERIVIESGGLLSLNSPKEALYTGNSGTTTRLLTGLIAGLKLNAEIKGDSTIQKRPMNRIKIPLEEMGANISLINDEYPPIKIQKSELTSITYEMPVASAQVKSAIIFAALGAKGETKIIEKNISRNHTELMLADFGANIRVDNNIITVKRTDYLNAQEVRVPGDISSAAFLMVLAAIIPGSDITIRNVSLNETRNGIITIFKKIDANMTVTVKNNDGEPYGDIRIKYKENLKPFMINETLIPKLIDEIPILTVLGLFLNGKSTIKDAQELRVKETDRIVAVTNELKKFNASFNIFDDGYEIIPTNNLTQSIEQLKSYSDHRIIMMLIIMTIKMNQKLNIDDMSHLNVSYPNILDDIDSITKEVDYE
ncbi:3-phosphoshikimate 1-carboxyvinyltransferase [Nosocomiicoccus ampullae]|uniref:3-phosphoshikimate 1-carboxyvinyltransferase n=1 Tax=Nosocomiicoccus ampullae TaxID=489910 RepID=A0A9Q2D071_9STAP|nr:3-phosphoshikimate 1-carboxyvinyltransferase [Nosocomiicoccus ampullae]MBB5176365.1 3-phosphoshikimate 1-carboxyvinyltransferase [Nosocomiicoccus ampullae]QYA46217.1 3-phosphoshikimate 1-carboxyvinyltransferase [Nosocomiicoccus ampullae]